MSTEMTSGDFFRAAKGPFGIIWQLGKLAYRGGKAAQDAAKKRKQIANLKSELYDLGFSNIDSVHNAWSQGKITFEDYMTIKTILEN
jgi:hypothetical protein